MKTPKCGVTETTVALQTPLLRGARRLRIALVGLPGAGKTTLFDAVSSTAPQTGELSDTHRVYRACTVQIGLDEASVVDLPSLSSVHHLQHDELSALKYLLWGNDRPPVTLHEASAPPVPFEPPDLIIQVVDASNLQSHLELSLELSRLGRPVVLALNQMDRVHRKGQHINVRALSSQLGVPVVPVVALMGYGISELFKTAVQTARQDACPLPQAPSPHIAKALEPLSQALKNPQIEAAFRVPHQLLLTLFACGHGYFESELNEHFAPLMPTLLALRETAGRGLPRALADEIHADGHHRAATMFEAALRPGPVQASHGWRYWLDEFLLHPQWGLVGSLAVFAGVLFVVFEVSGWIDAQTTQRLIEAASSWQPQGTLPVVVHAVMDGFIGLIGIVVPYMLPLLLMLIALEEMGLMQRIAFVVDRGFHKIGLHGGVAVPFLLGLGCNVPAIAAVARTSAGRERVIASVLITFVPCSARSAIILAVAGKYLGVWGVIGIYALTLVLIAVMGRLLSRQRREVGPGQVQEIPAYRWPDWRAMLHETWLRSSDVLTIVTPLLVGGSVVLALLGHWGADSIINTLLTPLTTWWLGLPLVLGLPLLFGVLRKELSLLMIFQALGTQDIDAVLGPVQIVTLLVFLTFYVPCISTFAVMHRTLGRKEAWLSVLLSVAVALVLSAVVRLLLTLVKTGLG
ncbi:MAG: ferrous iron transporter B [Comamonadaceae bacterium CG_4_9_14_0_8_um_filter_60_18]|nr:MAG: ferrous iron transporter B [Comamonadaceae bacterium CG17_big_fil_post_rev_8_21_14_2_50_60_13]PJC12367.1 MAG: ferrous iron transporter B [Comamonadaceae bacterium CG_4_9_14_0_8_um_filter_60_18]